MAPGVRGENKPTPGGKTVSGPPRQTFFYPGRRRGEAGARRAAAAPAPRGASRGGCAARGEAAGPEAAGGARGEGWGERGAERRCPRRRAPNFVARVRSAAEERGREEEARGAGSGRGRAAEGAERGAGGGRAAAGHGKKRQRENPEAPS